MPSLSSMQSATDLSSKADVNALVTDAREDVAGLSSDKPPATKRDLRFWLVILAVCTSLFLSALEFTSVSTALPTIVNDLHGEDFVWVASAYPLAATALLPASGGMAEVFGRRVTMIGALFLFALGSALCGAAQNMNWLIAARTIQGAGGGGILSISGIIISDLVPLHERAIFIALFGLTWSVACAIGPSVGGALAKQGQWRWLFYLNLPINGVAAFLVLIFLRLKTPRGSLREKFGRMDWIGNFLIIASSSSTVIALTWGGVQFPWTSPHVLAPLIIGLVGIIIFFAYEAIFAIEPLVPFTLIANRTSISGYLQTFITPVITLAIIYYLPIYYQACKGSSPVHAGVQLLAISMVLGPCVLISGFTITRTNVYRPQLWTGWVIITVAMGAMSIIRADTPTATAVGIPVLAGVGLGFLYQSTYYPVLAPLPIANNAHAMAFFAFCRIFAGVWGVTIGTAVLQTQLKKRLPAEFVTQFPQGVAIAYSTIPIISTLEEPLRSEVRKAFADSIAVIWQVMVGIAGIGVLASLFMKGLPLHTQVDAKWGLEEREERNRAARDMEMSATRT